MLEVVEEHWNSVWLAQTDWEEEHFFPSARRVLLDRQEHSATPELVSLQVSLRCCKDEVFVV